MRSFIAKYPLCFMVMSIVVGALLGCGISYVPKEREVVKQFPEFPTHADVIITQPGNSSNPPGLGNRRLVHTLSMKEFRDLMATHESIVVLRGREVRYFVIVSNEFYLSEARAKVRLGYDLRLKPGTDPRYIAPSSVAYIAVPDGISYAIDGAMVGALLAFVTIFMWRTPTSRKLPQPA